MSPNVIEPQPETEHIPLSNDPVDVQKLEAAMGLRSVEFIDYLGLGEDRFDTDVMEKVNTLVEHYPDLDSLMTADVNMGDKFGMTKLDKIYSFVLLTRQEEKLSEKQELIRKAKQQYV